LGDVKGKMRNYTGENAMAKETAVSPAMDTDWRGESDYGSLQRACEIIADKIRMRGVLRHNAKQRAVNTKMSSMLASFRAKGKLY
jgi:hypothetical protein